EERFLLFEAQCILDHRSEPHTRAHAHDRIEPHSAEQRAGIVRALERAYPTLPPLRLRPRRRFFHKSLLLTTDWSLTAEATVFVEDFVDEDVLIELLRSECVGIWQGVLVRPHVLPALLRATDHDEAVVRKAAIDALYDKTIGSAERTVKGTPFEPDALRNHRDAVDALARRLSDDDAQTVRKAAAILRQVILLDASFGQRIGAAARLVLAKWSSDLSTTGTLERLLSVR
ncbi:MAG: hypothetical protein JWQ20_4641, partial [Conexibacter sp.]|nr:hypothetical protein [Conexibacter sp.]